MTALIGGRHRAGRGNANAETARVVGVFRDLAAQLGRAPSFAELTGEMTRRHWKLTPEHVRLHLGLARLRVREGETT